MTETKTLSEQEVTAIVAERLPKWKLVCSQPDVPIVMLTQGAFSTSEDDMFLLAVAIKYAGIVKKDVTIVAGPANS